MSLNFKKNIATGLLVLVPIAMAGWVLYFSFMWVDTLLWDRLRFSFVREGGIPGVGFIIVLLIVFLTGLVTNDVLGGRVVRWWEGKLLKVPLFNKIYGPTKQVSAAFFSPERKNLFKSVGMIEYLARNAWTVAFEINSVPESMARHLAPGPIPEEMMVVFIPTPPNPATGFVVMVPRRAYRVLPMSIEDGIKITVSCGVYMPTDPVVTLPDPVVNLAETPDLESGQRRGA